MSARVDYLSNEWINAVADSIKANSEIIAVARENTVSVTQIVTGTPHGDVTYHLESRDGQLNFGKGPAKVSDIAFTQDWQTAVGVATGKINAQEAFISGKIRFKGDHERVIATQPLFLALDAVFRLSTPIQIFKRVPGCARHRARRSIRQPMHQSSCD